MKLLSLVLICTLSASSAQAALFQPDSATASSTFSSLYDIGNTIDGSGMPANFGPGDGHANYTTNNHWTTANGHTVGEYADFFFDSPVTIGIFYLWNHRSNVISSNDDYEITQFNLLLYDSTNTLVHQLLNATAVGETAFSQAYVFAPVSDISRVRFVVVQTQQELQIPPNTGRYTGFAEVAFDSIPEPTSLAVMGFSVLAMMRRRVG